MAAHGGLSSGLGLTLLATVLLCAEQLPVKTYTTADGLARNNVYCTVQDPRGFLWFCTSEGLSRFDGYTFTNYGPEHGLPKRGVSALLISRLGIYWAGTPLGLYRFDPNSSPPQKFEAVRLTSRETGWPLNYVTSLLEDRSGAIWAGTYGGLYRLEADKAAWQFVDIGIPKRAPHGEQMVNCLLEDRRGTLWIGGEGPIYWRAPDGRTTSYLYRWRGGAVVVLYEDRLGRIWASDNSAVYRLNPNPGPNNPIVTRSYTVRDGLPGNRIEALLESSDGRFWVGGYGGLGEYIPATDKFESYTTAQGLTDPGVKSLTEDKEGNLWVGTEAGGVMKIARSGFTSYTQADGLANTRIASIFVDQDGELCAVSFHLWKWSLDCFNGKRFNSIRPNYPRAIQHFGWGWNQTAFQDHAGEWWIPTGEGLCRFGKTNRAEELTGRVPKAVYTTRDGLPGNDIFRLFEDSRGDIWISTAGRPVDPPARWERASGSFHVYSAADGLPRLPESATAFAEDHSGQIWMGFYSGGLARFQNGHFTLYNESDGVPTGMIRALHVDRAGRLWIASVRGGLARIEHPAEAEPRFVTYTTAEGLSNDSTFAITEDLWGRIYVGTGRGIDRLDPATGHIKHYTTADGLARGELSAVMRDRQGALWFGTLLGLSRLIPEPDRRASPPPILITGLQMRGVSRPLAEVGQANVTDLVLQPNQNQVRIDFVGLGFAPGESLRYQYRLTGAESDWNPPTDQRTVNYASLRPGRYMFEVRALNTEGAVSPQPAFVAFTLQAPVWQRWWFESVAALALASLIYALYRYRVQQLLAVERMRARIATDLHDDIGSSLSQIAILSEVAQRKSENAGTLSDIATISGELVDGISDIVWAINPQHDHLGNLEYRMRRFANDALGARNIDVEFRSAAADPGLHIGADVRRQVFLIFKEAVNNIARHADASHATVEFIVAQDRLLLRVVDDGRGFDPAAAADGNGLANIRKRATDLSGAVELESVLNWGTTLTLRVPIAHQHWGGRKVGR